MLEYSAGRRTAVRHPDLNRANFEAVKDTQMDGPIIKPNQQHINRIITVFRGRVKNRID